MRHCTTFGVPRLIFFQFVFDLFWPQYNWNFNLWTLGHDIYDPEYKEINGVVESTSSMFVNFNIVQLTSVLMPYKFTVPLLLLLPHSICRHAHPLQQQPPVDQVLGASTVAGSRSTTRVDYPCRIGNLGEGNGHGLAGALIAWPVHRPEKYGLDEILSSTGSHNYEKMCLPVQF